MIINLRKNGMFYSAYDDDAIILHSLFGYKIVQGRVGFPLDSYNKVINKLDELHIDYKTYDNETIVHFDDNKYDLYLIDSKNKTALDIRINKIENQIKNMDYNNLNKLIDIIEKFINEAGKVPNN